MPKSKRSRKTKRRQKVQRFDIWDALLVILFVIGVALIVFFSTWKNLALIIGGSIVESVVLAVIITRIVTKAMK